MHTAKTSYMMRGAVSGGMSSKLIGHLVIFKHRVIFAIKILLMFMIKLCMLEFDQNILSKYHLKETSHYFITTKRQRKTCFVEG